VPDCQSPQQEDLVGEQEEEGRREEEEEEEGTELVFSRNSLIFTRT
jgi:hypothetical protein